MIWISFYSIIWKIHLTTNHSFVFDMLIGMLIFYLIIVSRITIYKSLKMIFHLWKSQYYQDRPQIKWEYPLNLSILISGGKETNKDSLSNGEWSGKSSNLKSSTWESRWIVVFGFTFWFLKYIKIPWKGVSKKVIILWII